MFLGTCTAMSHLTLHDLSTLLSARGLGARLIDGAANLSVAAAVRARGVSGVQHDSRAIVPGDVFVAIPGAKVDGAAFAVSAVARGAVAIITEQARPEFPHPQIIVTDARLALSLAAAAVYGDAKAPLPAVGITGTKGKTTTAHLIEQALQTLNWRPAMLGTIENRGPGFVEDATHTTPEGDVIARFERRAQAAGATHLVMEVSSIALSLHRADGVSFRVAAFTNLGRDHLDFHHTLEHYFEAKARLFTELAPISVVNVDDGWGAKLAARLVSLGRPVLRCSLDPKAGSEVELRAESWSQGRDGVRATVRTPSGVVELASPLLGQHNLENLLVALGTGIALGFAASDFAAALQTAPGAPGRLKPVANSLGLKVLVDYAHTAESVARVIEAVRPLTPRRLWVVFGCGGDRDPGKRPLMGQAAVRGADHTIITSDNPRTEDPEKILDAIEAGIRAIGVPALHPTRIGDAQGFTRMADRRLAIATAVALAQPGDTVLIVGKGHETYQIVGTTKHPFDDRAVAAAALRQREAGPMPMKFDGRAVVLGLGASGISAVKALKKLGARVVAADAKTATQLGETAATLEQLGAELALGGHDPAQFAAADLVVVSPGVPPEKEPVASALKAAESGGAAIIGEVDLAARQLESTVIGITGSNGKSTVTTWIGEMCQATGRPTFVGGNLGTPLCDAIGSPAAKPSGIVVAELSSFQLERADGLRCHVALLLNVTENHLERYRSFMDYAAAKARIFRSQRPGDVALVPDGDALARSLAQGTAGTVMTFGGSTGAVRVVDGRIVDVANGLNVPVSELRVVGAHNVMNACAAALAARLVGVPMPAIAASLRQFAGLHHRMQFVVERGGVTFYDDSKATSVGAVQTALTALEDRVDGKIVLIAGGVDKGGSYRPLREPLARQGKAVVLLGQAAPLMAQALEGAVPVMRVADMAEAVRAAKRLAEPGDAVLLSPACASFDMFTSYSHRGDVFQREVLAVGTQRGGGRVDAA